MFLLFRIDTKEVKDMKIAIELHDDLVKKLRTQQFDIVQMLQKAKKGVEHKKIEHMTKRLLHILNFVYCKILIIGPFHLDSDNKLYIAFLKMIWYVRFLLTDLSNAIKELLFHFVFVNCITHTHA